AWPGWQGQRQRRHDAWPRSGQGQRQGHAERKGPWAGSHGWAGGSGLAEQVRLEEAGAPPAQEGSCTAVARAP
ncbi:unnamed protein product, partial [Effrenium voratum]